MSQPDSLFSALHTLKDRPASCGTLSRRFTVGKLEFLRLAQMAVAVMDGSPPGSCWTMDGYKSDTLFLRALHHRSWPDRREVTFQLEFIANVTVVSVQTDESEILGLYRAFIVAMDRLRPTPLRGQWSP